MDKHLDDFVEIGYVFFELKDDENAILTEINSSFALRRAKIKFRNRIQSIIYASKDNEHFIYIEELAKWYFNKDLFNNQDIVVKLYDDLMDMPVIEEVNEENMDDDYVPENLISFGYIVYKIINYNYISYKYYASKILLEKDNISDKKNHINQLYKHEEYRHVYFIKNLNKWFYGQKLNNTDLIVVKLYDTFSDIPLEDYSEKDKNGVQYDDNKSFKNAQLHRLNERSIFKDLSFLGYILFEFTSINHIKYQIFDKRTDATVYLSEYNQINKCFKRYDNENIIYINLLNGWVNKCDSSGKIYEKFSDISIPKEKETKPVEINNSNKLIFKTRKLVPGGWIYYEFVDDNIIIARHYKSSNQLLVRLDDGGDDSQYYKSRIKNVCFIKKINKWYYYDESLEKEDVKLELFDEEEIFK